MGALLHRTAFTSNMSPARDPVPTNPLYGSTPIPPPSHSRPRVFPRCFTGESADFRLRLLTRLRYVFVLIHSL